MNCSLSQKSYIVTSVSALFLVLSPVLLPAKDVTFQWTANPEPLSGYKLYYQTGPDTLPPFDGTGIVAGNSPITIGKSTTYTVTGLSDDETYHFALTAINGTDESGYSTIVTINPTQSPNPDTDPAPTILDITVK